MPECNLGMMFSVYVAASMSRTASGRVLPIPWNSSSKVSLRPHSALRHAFAKRGPSTRILCCADRLNPPSEADVGPYAVNVRFWPNSAAQANVRYWPNSAT